jgi:mannose-1-phosphate guanylyltransferase
MTTTMQLDRNIEASYSAINRWGVILAGGDGKRLLPLTRRLSGDDRPKQFCSLISGATLLNETRLRLSSIISPDQTIIVVTRKHERFYVDQLDAAALASLVVQPYNRGTTLAIMSSLMRLRSLSPNAVVGFFPSDHHFGNAGALAEHVESAFRFAGSAPGQVVLLGVAPDGPEVQYGWIEPGQPVETRASDWVFRVRSVWEKPSLPLASSLMARGCLWNSFVMVGQVDSFIDLVRRVLPDLVQSFESTRATLLTSAAEAVLNDLYSSAAASNFSSDVLAACPRELSVLFGVNLGWTDLGEAARVLTVLGRKPTTLENQSVELSHGIGAATKAFV